MFRRSVHQYVPAYATAVRALSAFAAALGLAFAAMGEAPAPYDDWADRPSEIWSPYPSEHWSPRPSSVWSPRSTSAWSAPAAEQLELRPPLLVAQLPADDGVSFDGVGFGVPPLSASPCECPDAPSSFGAPHDGWRVQSHFMPSLGRFGLVAPRAPGVESVHSPYLATGPVIRPGPPLSHAPSLFDPPPGGCDPAHAIDQHAPHHESLIDPRAQFAPYSSDDFTPDPFFDHIPWDDCEEQGIYGGKYLNPVQRPLVEWGMPLYLNGPVPPPTLEFGPTNPSLKRFYVYGDYRAAAAYNAQSGSDLGVIAHRLNLELDLWLTSTERIHAFVGPLQRGGDFTRVEFDGGDTRFREELDFFDEDTDTLFFEGDLGAMIGGATGVYAPYDLPIAVGLIPLLFQNGIWMEDAIVGMAMTIPARNSPLLDWSNYDVTFFFGVDKLNSPAFDANDSANVFGATAFVEAKGGYLEAGYAFVDDPAGLGRSYHNLGVSYTRRYLNLISNSMRVILNAGQDGPSGARTADGVLLLAENSFLTPWPYNVIPYVNLFAGFDSPQSVARAGAAGGVLRNTGILFESDNLTGYPTLDASGNETCGAAIGVDLLAPEFTHQLILEAAVLQTFGDPATRVAPGDQYGLGARYQVPISHAHLIRFDVMHGWLENTDDVTGARIEFRWKF